MDSKIIICKICGIELNESNRARKCVRCVDCHKVKEQEQRKTYRDKNIKLIMLNAMEYNINNRELINERNRKSNRIKAIKKYGYHDETIKQIEDEYDKILPKMTTLYNYVDKPLPKREMTVKLKEMTTTKYYKFLKWLEQLYDSDIENTN